MLSFDRFHKVQSDESRDPNRYLPRDVVCVTVLCSLVTRLPIKTGHEGEGSGQSIARVLGWQMGTVGP